MILKKRKKEGKVDYDIKLYSNKEYELFFNFPMESKMLMSALSCTKAYQDGLVTQLEDEWDVKDQKVMRILYPTVKKVLRRLAKEIRKDVGENFTFVTIRIENIHFKKVDDKTYKCDVKIVGDYFV